MFNKITSKASRFLITIGLCALCFLAGSTVHLKVGLNVAISDGAQAAEYDKKIEILSSALPLSQLQPKVPPRKPAPPKGE